MITYAKYRALAEFRHQLRKFIAFSDAEARAAGLEPAQHQLLLAVKGLPTDERPTIGAIAKRLVLRHHSVVELVDRLVEKGLVARQENERDRREIFVIILPEGERSLRTLSLAHDRELERAGPALIEAIAAIAPAARGER